MDRIIDCPDMTSAVYRGRKAQTQLNNFMIDSLEINFYLLQPVTWILVNIHVLLKLNE